LALGFNYYAHGRETAPIVIKILKGTRPSDVPVRFAKELELWVNLDTAEKIGFSSSSLLDTCREFANKLRKEGVEVDIKTDIETIEGK